MKKFIYLTALFTLVALSGVQAQKNSSPSVVGKKAEILRKLQDKNKLFELTLNDGTILPIEIGAEKKNQNGDLFIGKVKKENSILFISLEATTVSGRIILKESKKAFKIYSDRSDNILVEEAGIHTVVCSEYYEPSANATGEATTLPAGINLYELQSHPAAEAVIKLDFDGEYVPSSQWSSTPIDAQAALLSNEERYDVWKRISEDFSAFNLNITTSETIFQNAPEGKKMKVIFTPTNEVAPGAGGVAYIGSFSWENAPVCWVFNSGSRYAAEAGSHEVGHTLSLRHDRYEGGEYYPGHGNWAPIMGESYYRSITQWSKGEYHTAYNQEDDIALITGNNNGFGFRADDHGNSMANASELLYDASGKVHPAVNTGIIENSHDMDVFSFSTKGGTINIQVGTTASEANLDVHLILRNASNAIVASASPAGTLSASLNTAIPEGTYFLSIEGVGEGDPLYTGYSDYGSIGSYTISGSIPVHAPNLAYMRPVVVSSSFNTTNSGGAAVDANGTTRWESAYANNQSLVVDLGANYSINSVKIAWEAAYAKDYQIQTSNDNVSWTTIQEVWGKSTSDTDEHTGLQGTARYVKIYCINRATVYGFSIFEFEVYGTTTNLPPLVKMTSPTDNTSFGQSEIFLSANASDDGGIARVEFYQGNTLLGTSTTTPYTYSWKNVAEGSYTITAKAYDNTNLVSTSSAVTAHVRLSNLALNKTITASSVENEINLAAHAVDGKTDTRWASQYSDHQWIEIDLGDTYLIERVKILWEAAYGKEYKIQVASPSKYDSSKEWRDIHHVSNNTSLLNDWAGLAGSGRYIRILGISRGTVYGYSIYELEIEGRHNHQPIVSITSPANNTSIPAPGNFTITASASDPDGTIAKVELLNDYGAILGTDYTSPYTFDISNLPGGTYSYKVKAYDNHGQDGISEGLNIFVTHPNLAFGKPVTVSSVESSALGGANAVDGKLSSRWSSQYADPQWLYVDLQGRYDVNRIKITWETACARDFQLQTSTDAINWTTIRTATNNSTLELDYRRLLNASNVRYIRVYGTARTTNYGYSIYELEVYGNPVASQPTEPQPEASSAAIELYPNPSAGTAVLKFHSRDDINAEVEVTVMDHYSIVRKRFHKPAQQNHLQLAFPDVADGIYIVKINNGRTIKTQRLIIKK